MPRTKQAKPSRTEFPDTNFLDPLLLQEGEDEEESVDVGDVEDLPLSRYLNGDLTLEEKDTVKDAVPEKKEAGSSDHQAHPVEEPTTLKEDVSASEEAGGPSLQDITEKETKQKVLELTHPKKCRKRKARSNEDDDLEYKPNAYEAKKVKDQLGTTISIYREHSVNVMHACHMKSWGCVNRACTCCFLNERHILFCE